MKLFHHTNTVDPVTADEDVDPDVLIAEKTLRPINGAWVAAGKPRTGQKSARQILEDRREAANDSDD